MSSSVCGTCEHDIRGSVPEHHSGRQLFGVAAEKELAERQSSVHQEYHGPARKDFLSSEFWIWSNKCLSTFRNCVVSIYVCVCVWACAWSIVVYFG